MEIVNPTLTDGSPSCLLLPDHLIPVSRSSGRSQGSATSVGSSISATVELDGRSSILVTGLPVSSIQTSNRGHENTGHTRVSRGPHRGQGGAGWATLTFVDLLAFPRCGGLLTGDPFQVFIGVGLGIFQLRPRSHGLWTENRAYRSSH